MDAILAQSEHQRNALQRNYGLGSQVAGMFVAPPGEILPFEARTAHALWVSNIRQVKRPDVLLELAGTLPEVVFRMVGGPLPGAEQEFVRARDMAAALPNVQFSGAMPYAQTGDAYAQARLLVNTSDVEGFPNSYLQAWSHGLPVVAFFDPDGIIRRHGLGIAVQTPAQMRDAVLSLTQDRAAWALASRRCLDYMAAEFGEERVLEPYLRAFGAATRGARQPA
jgi:glycosyltransferase involved in cell wall biosynthesis